VRTGRILIRMSWVIALLVAGLFSFAPTATAQEPRTLRGTVLDSTGLPIRGAEVEFQLAGESRSTASGDDGTFEIPVNDGGVLIVRQPGFAAAFGCKKASPMVPAESCRVW